VLVVKLVLYQY